MYCCSIIERNLRAPSSLVKVAEEGEELEEKEEEEERKSNQQVLSTVGIVVACQSSVKGAQSGHCTAIQVYKDALLVKFSLLAVSKLSRKTDLAKPESCLI